MNRDHLHQAIEHALAAALILVVSGFWLGDALWRAEYSILLIIAAFSGTYFICAIFLIYVRSTEGRISLRQILISGIAAFGAAFMFLAFMEWQWPAKFGAELPSVVPFTSSALGMLMLLGLFLISDARAVKLVILTLSLIASIAAHVGWSRKVSTPPTRDVTHLNTSLFVLRTTTYRNWVSDALSKGGAIAAFNDGYLLLGGDGVLYVVKESRDASSLDLQKLSYRVPFNPIEFDHDALRGVGKGPQIHGGNNNRLRASDLLVQQRPHGSIRLLVSHHFWKAEDACVVVRVSMLEGSQGEFLGPIEKLKWRTMFETTPCLTLNVGGERGIRFGALQGGGAMALLNENELLLTVGDHEFDGVNRTPALPQDPGNSYGKIMLIRLDGGRAETFSLGHRNPQGLYVDSAGIIWSTEHGPRGGDELNQIRRGANYGWPLVTYGTDYGLHHWPPSSAPGRHEGFEKPKLVFVPSIAPSALTGISGKLFGAWQGDLLLVSLSGELRRVRMEDGRVVLAEPFAIGDKIRDLAEGRDGRIVLWTDLNELVFLEPASVSDEESPVFQCTGCHTLNKWERASIGPNLWNVIGKEVGADDEFEYSEAMLGFGGRWTKDRLDQFLANPRGTVPGTTMQFEGISDAKQREQLIEYLDRSLRD